MTSPPLIQNNGLLKKSPSPPVLLRGMFSETGGRNDPVDNARVTSSRYIGSAADAEADLAAVLGALAAVAAAVAVSIAVPHFAHFIRGASRSAATEYFA